MHYTFRRWTLGAVALGVLGLNASIVRAQVATPNPKPPVATTAEVSDPDTYGPVGNIIYNLGPDDFSVQSGGWSNAYLLTNRYILPINGGTSVSLSAPLHLPSGALVTSITVHYLDYNTTSDPSASLVISNTTGGTSGAHTISFPVFSAGYNSVTHVPTTAIQIDNTYKYSILVDLTRNVAQAAHALIGVRVNYRLQVSPAPAFATFADVPVGHPFHQFVEALLASGITAGCGGGNYCPNAPVTRGQMAVFLAAALGLHWPN